MALNPYYFRATPILHQTVQDLDFPYLKHGSFNVKCLAFQCTYTPKTGIPVEEGDSILMLLRRGSHPEIQLGVGIHSELDFFYYQL